MVLGTKFYILSKNICCSMCKIVDTGPIYRQKEMFVKNETKFFENLAGRAVNLATPHSDGTAYINTLHISQHIYHYIYHNTLLFFLHSGQYVRGRRGGRDGIN